MVVLNDDKIQDVAVGVGSRSKEKVTGDAEVGEFGRVILVLEGDGSLAREGCGLSICLY